MDDLSAFEDLLAANREYATRVSENVLFSLFSKFASDTVVNVRRCST